MGLLVLCIVCNVLLAVIFKWFVHYGVNNLRAIIINYFVCVAVSSLFLAELSIPNEFWTKRWIWHALSLSAIFIIGFNLLAQSFQKAGVSLTVMLQKMSLLLPVLFAVLCYGEDMNMVKGAGIVAAMLAVVLVNYPGKSDKGLTELSGKVLILPVLVFLLSGIIEIILYHVQVEGFLGGEGIYFTSSAFAMAGTFGVAFVGLTEGLQGIKASKRDVIGGVVLGIPNFLTIYLLVVLLDRGWEGSILFPINNVSILVLTSVVGYVWFRESSDMMKFSGLLMGVLAILLLGLG